MHSARTTVHPQLADADLARPSAHARHLPAPFDSILAPHVYRKKFLIENLDGTKVVSRKKGFTTTTCVSGVAIGQQTKRFEALPESAKVSWLYQRLRFDPCVAVLTSVHHMSAAGHQAVCIWFSCSFTSEFQLRCILFICHKGVTSLPCLAHVTSLIDWLILPLLQFRSAAHNSALCSLMQQTTSCAARQLGQIWSRPAMRRVLKLAQLP